MLLAINKKKDMLKYILKQFPGKHDNLNVVLVILVSTIIVGY